jgi:hypothetical protein
MLRGKDITAQAKGTIEVMWGTHSRHADLPFHGASPNTSLHPSTFTLSNTPPFVPKLKECAATPVRPLPQITDGPSARKRKRADAANAETDHAANASSPSSPDTQAPTSSSKKGKKIDATTPPQRPSTKKAVDASTPSQRRSKRLAAEAALAATFAPLVGKKVVVPKQYFGKTYSATISSIEDDGVHCVLLFADKSDVEVLISDAEKWLQLAEEKAEKEVVGIECDDI